jgi:DNA-binding transcriptional LysR family regulator
VFVTVAEQGGFSAAAARLGRGQPTVTYAVQKLESHVGVKLFHRTGGPPRLTPEGERMFPLAQRILREMTDLRRMVQGKEPFGHTDTAAAPDPVEPPLMEGASPRADAQPQLGVLDEVWRQGGVRSLPLHLVLVSKLIDRYLSDMLARHSSLTIAEWRVVAVLSFLERSTVRTIARQACVDPAEVSRSVAALTKRGLIRRAANPQHRRSPLLSLTDSGVAEFKRFRPHWQRLSARLMSEVDAERAVAIEGAMVGFARACLNLLGGS